MKKINVDFVVGLFMVGGFLCFVYLSLQLGEFSVFSMEKKYVVTAHFNGISGLKEGAIVEIAGVPVGKVYEIKLDENDQANVTMQIKNDVKITEDAIASIKTQGIIGDKFVKITPGGSDIYLEDGGTIFETESAVDIEGLVSKFIFEKL